MVVSSVLEGGWSTWNGWTPCIMFCAEGVEPVNKVISLSSLICRFYSICPPPLPQPAWPHLVCFSSQKQLLDWIIIDRVAHSTSGKIAFCNWFPVLAMKALSKEFASSCLDCQDELWDLEIFLAGVVSYRTIKKVPLWLGVWHLKDKFV